MRNLLGSFFIHEQMKTTINKAKAIGPLAERLITKAKIGSLHIRRQILAFLPNKKAVNKLIEDIAPRFKNRQAGFTKITRLGSRKGDDAMMVKMELVEKKPEKILKASNVSEVSKISKVKKK